MGGHGSPQVLRCFAVPGCHKHVHTTFTVQEGIALLLFVLASCSLLVPLTARLRRYLGSSSYHQLQSRERQPIP